VVSDVVVVVAPVTGSVAVLLEVVRSTDGVLLIDDTGMLPLAPNT
jgi:hypothetical protein